MTSNGKMLSWTTVQQMMQLQSQLDENRTRMRTFTDRLTERIGGNILLHKMMMVTSCWILRTGMIRLLIPSLWLYLNMELALPRGGGEV
jgi:hypothetical protein